MRAPSWAASGRGWFGPLSRSRLPFRRWLSLLRGCLIWRLATDGLVMAPVTAQLAQARRVTGSAVHTSHTQHPQSGQPNPNPNPPISCKRPFFFLLSLFSVTFVPPAPKSCPALLNTVLFPLTRSLVCRRPQNSTRYYVARVIACTWLAQQG